MNSPAGRRLWHLLLRILVLLLFGGGAAAHDEPTSFIDLRIGAEKIEVILVASVTDLAHDLPAAEPAMLLQPDMIERHRGALAASVLSRLKVLGDGAPITLQLMKTEPDAEKKDLRCSFHGVLEAGPAVFRVEGHLFPYDPRHQTFLNVYFGSTLERQEVLSSESPAVEFKAGARQPMGKVFREFLVQGVHHIFIGPDHILFIIGLLLLGGGVKQLLKIITAFTVAHSITLALATFGILNPPASIVEPVIALSIVCVGIYALFGRSLQDRRLVLAGCFGLVHGFGFAFVLQEMGLPQGALGLSLFAFNLGVEVGQVAIILAIAPLLAALYRHSPAAGRRLVAFAALVIITAGSFWFMQRVLG